MSETQDYDISELMAQAEREGFSFETIPEEDFIVLSTEGFEGSGKTHLALQAEGPIFLQNLDDGDNGVVQKAQQRGTKVARKRYKWSINLETLGIKKGAAYQAAKAQADAEAEKLRAGVWGQFVSDYQKAIKAGFRTIIWDKATDVYELIRLANFGKLSQVPETEYVKINGELKELIKECRDARVNLIMTHELRAVYKSQVVMTNQGAKEQRMATGEWERSGFGRLGYLVDAYVRQSFIPAKREAGVVTEPERWEVEVVRKARHNPQAIGSVLQNPDWETLMSVIGPSKYRKVEEGLEDLDISL